MNSPLLFSPFTLRDIELKNRVVIAPMHQYSGVRGFPTDWHVMSVGRYAAGGAGLVFVESTKVERRGCGTVGDLGLWNDEFIPYFKKLSDFIRMYGSCPGIQLGHSGRKARRYRPWEGGKPPAGASVFCQWLQDMVRDFRVPNTWLQRKSWGSLDWFWVFHGCSNPK